MYDNLSQLSINLRIGKRIFNLFLRVYIIIILITQSAKKIDLSWRKDNIYIIML